MNENQLKGLRESLDEFGEILPILVRPQGEGYEIIDGQHRFELQQENEEIHAVVIEADEIQARRLTQIINRTHGEDNPQKLKELLEYLSEQTTIEEIIRGTPIASEEEFNELMESLENGLEDNEGGGGFGGGLTDDDEIPEDNQDIDEDKLSQTNHKCPECGYEW